MICSTSFSTFPMSLSTFGPWPSRWSTGAGTTCCRSKTTNPSSTRTSRRPFPLWQATGPDGFGAGKAISADHLSGHRLTCCRIDRIFRCTLRSLRAIAGDFYEVEPADPAVFASVSALLVLVAAAACHVPASRAMRVDPALVLREE